MKEKSSQPDKDTQEPSSLKTAGPDGEITAGFYIRPKICIFGLISLRSPYAVCCTTSLSINVVASFFSFISSFFPILDLELQYSQLLPFA